VGQRANPRFASFSRQLPRRYLELPREAGDALGAKITLQKAGRLTLPPFGSTETHVIVADNGSSSGHPSAKLLGTEFAAK
jgi:cbb3-type cytochrome oxidase subunit 3